MADTATTPRGPGPVIRKDDVPIEPGARTTDGSPARTCAYFDLDKTILATSSALALGSPMRRSGLISTVSLVRGVIAQLPYLLVGADENQTGRLMERLALMSAGVERAHLQEVVRDALATAIEPAVYAEALALIEAHHRAGHDVVVVSASSTEMVEPIAALVGADRAVATRMEVDAEGRFTGRIERSLLHGAKVDALLADASAHGIDLARSWAYSDSISDRPMLEAIGHPVAVNPDRDLRRLAGERGWPARDFERPIRVRARRPGRGGGRANRRAGGAGGGRGAGGAGGGGGGGAGGALRAADPWGRAPPGPGGGARESPGRWRGARPGRGRARRRRPRHLRHFRPRRCRHDDGAPGARGPEALIATRLNRRPSSRPGSSCRSPAPPGSP